MKEGELLLTHHVGDVINILQKTTHYLFDPDDLLTVTVFTLASLKVSSRHCCRHLHTMVSNFDLSIHVSTY